jgi:hypothetical protein
MRFRQYQTDFAQQYCELATLLEYYQNDAISVIAIFPKGSEIAKMICIEWSFSTRDG